MKQQLSALSPCIAQYSQRLNKPQCFMLYVQELLGAGVTALLLQQLECAWHGCKVDDLSSGGLSCQFHALPDAGLDSTATCPLT